MAGARDFKFGTQLGFAKDHQKITPGGKSAAVLWLGELLKILRLFYNISATAGCSDFKFGTLLGFAKAHDKTTPRGKVGVSLGWGVPQNLGVPL